MSLQRADREVPENIGHDERDILSDKSPFGSSRIPWDGNRATSSGSQFDSFVMAPFHPQRGKPARKLATRHRWRPWNALFRFNYLSIFGSLESAGEKTILVVSVVSAVAAGLPLPVIGYIFGQIVNDFPPEAHALHERLLQLLAVAVVYFGATSMYTIGFGLTAESISVKLRRRILACLLFLDQAYLDTHDIDVDGFLTEKIDTIRAGCSEKVGIFLQSIAYFVAAATVGFVLNAKLTGILLASVVPAFVICFFSLSSAVSDNTRTASVENARAHSIVESAVRALKIVQAFDMMGELCHRHLSCIEPATKASVAKAAFIAVQSASAYFVGYGANALAFYLGTRLASTGNAGSVYAVVFLILDASFVVGQFAPFLEIFARAAAANGIVQHLLNDHQSNANNGTYRHGTLKPDLHNKDISFCQVVFRYPARPSVNILRGVNLTLRAGTLTAITGISGGGKSTLLACLLGIYEFDGLIEFGGHDIRLISPTYLRSRIAIVEQEAVLFSGSIFDNVCFGLEGQQITASEKLSRCLRALRDANVDFLDRLPRGIHTRIGNEIQLSGGQQQKICLARALMKQPSLLVLDEPTSALDAGSEDAVMKAIHAVTVTGTTVLMIAHRLSTTLNADTIVVMSAGQVVEQGTPQHLARAGTIFSSLLDAQSTTLPANKSSLIEGGIITEREKVQLSTADSTTSLSPSQEQDPEDTVGWSLVRQTCSLVKSDAGLLLIGLMASLVGGSILLAQAFVFGNLIQLLNMSRHSPTFYDRADFFCLVFFILALVAFASYAASGTAFGAVSASLAGRVQIRMLQKLLNTDIAWHAQAGHAVHELMTAFTKDPADLSALGGVAMGSIFTVLASLVGSIVLAHLVAWRIALVLLAAVPVMMFCGYVRLRLLTLAENRYRIAYLAPTSIAAEACRKRRTVTALCMEQRVIDEYQNALREPHRRVCTFIVGSNLLLSFCLSATYLIYALAYWWGSRQVRNGNYTTTQFFIVLPALLFSALSAGQIFSLSPEIARARSAARSIFKLLDAEPGIMDGEAQSGKSSTSATTTDSSSLQIHDPQKRGAALSLRNASLLYPGATGLSLDDVSLEIGPGETVAFVGPSGAGKSSAIALFERFFEPTTGSVLFDGKDVRELHPALLRAQIGLVTQTVDLFPGSIASNILLGARTGQDVQNSDIEAVCARCGLHSFISSMPEGYNTECGWTGSTRFSGGQTQRLTIARALIREPRLLLLDEPTSALDAHSDAQVQRTLREAAGRRTTVIVAHRLATIRHADKIFVFAQGKVVEQGTFTQLMELGGLFADMARAQSLA